MARKTAQRSSGESDLVNTTEREFLFVGDHGDARRINFEYDEPTVVQPVAAEPAVESLASQQTANQDHTPSVNAAQEPPAITAPQLAKALASRVADADLTPTDIILAIVGQKLRKSFDQVPLHESIRSLSAGICIQGTYNDLKDVY
jgi:fatty acid synthase subunit alpha, fungi type